MDPNETLRELREAIRRGDDMLTIAELWEALDEWLSKGGFFPAKWMTHDTARRAGLPPKG